MKKKLLEISTTLKQNTTSLLRNTENESYQQSMFHSLQISSSQIVQALLLIADCKTETSVFDHLVENYEKYATCVVTYCPLIAEMAKDSSFFTLSHKHHFSQSVLLALYLTNQTKRKVKLFISDGSFVGVSHMLANERQIDKVTFVKDSLINEGVQAQNILSWNNENIQLTIEDVIVIDLFNLSPAQYLPFMLKNYQRIKQCSKVYIYHSNLQDLSVGQLLSQLTNNNKDLDVTPLQLWAPHPYSIQFLKQQKALELKLVEFLQKDAIYPSKQDIVIFYPLRLSLLKYTIRLREILAKYNLKDQVNIISNKTAHQLKNKNNIFVVKDSAQLTTWNYDFSDVLYVIDYGTQSHFTFDYKYQCFVQSIQEVSFTERAKRIAWVGADRIGCYFSLRQTNSVQNGHYADEVQQLSLFLVKMIDYGLSNQIDKTNSRISSCLSLLQSTKIIKSQNNTYQILDERIIIYAKQGVQPFFSKLLLNVLDDPLLSAQEKRKNMTLLIMSITILKNQGDLRVIPQEIEGNHIKPYPIWRKSGYLESCLEILTKGELIQLRGKQSQSKSRSFRRQTSKMSQRVNSKVSRFEQDQSKRKRFEQMQIQDLIKQYKINEQLFYTMREQIDLFRQVFNVAPTGILLQKQDVNKNIKYLLKVYSKGVAFSENGLRYKQYFIGDDLFEIDRHSLLNYSNILPKMVIILRLEASEGKNDILLANSVSEEAYLSQFGSLPIARQISRKNTDHIVKPKLERTENLQDKQGFNRIEFNHVPSLVIQQFIKDKGILIDYFQEENNCQMQILQEQGTVLLTHSGQQDKIRDEFNKLLEELKQTVGEYLKIAPYLGNVSLSLGAGGIAKSLIIAQPVSRCIVQNLPMAVNQSDLINLFVDFKPKKIQILQPEADQQSKSAMVTLQHPKQYSKFYLTYHKCPYLGMKIIVRPFKASSQDLQERQKCNYIQFKWYIWRSHCKALVEFTNKEEANKALVDFTERPEFDGAKVAASLVGQCSLVLDCLSQFTDQIYIEETLRNFGEIKSVQILKTPLKQASAQDKHISYLIRTVFDEKQTINVKLGAIEKKAHGLRVCRGYCANIEHINKISQELNRTVAKIGQGRLYAQTWFQIPVLVPSDSMVIYQQLLQQTIALFPERPNIQSTIQHQNDKTYIILRSCIKVVVDLVHEKLSQFLQGHPIELPDQGKNVVLNDVGLANLLDLEEKYHCRMIINAQTQGLNVLISNQNLNKVKEEIKLKISDYFFYSIPINKKIYKLYLSEPEKLQEIKKNNKLRTLQLQQDSYSLLMEGSAINIQRTTNIYAIQNQPSNQIEQKRIIDTQICGICYESSQQSFTLCCNHNFCKQCLAQYIQFSLRDSSLFPLKCPHSECRKLIVAADLDSLMDGDDWKRLMVFASNKYVFEHEDLSFCFTAGCAQINERKKVHSRRITNEFFKCQLCYAEFCILCKQAHHPGKSCDELKNDLMFKQYIKQNGVRLCINFRCRVPVIRWTGCYHIQCTRCNMHMCFKCDPEQMEPYATEDECYRHLHRVHGGFN